MTDDDLGIYKIDSLKESSKIRVLPKFIAHKEKRKKEREKEEDRRRNTFKEDFFKTFKLDKDKFSVNLIKKDGRWFIEIYNKKTKKVFYQDYGTVCNILDIRCKLPKIIGANIDKKV